MSNPCPQNVWNHTDGCTCTPNGSVTAEVDVKLGTGTTVGPDFAARFRDEVEHLDEMWRNEPDTNSAFNDRILELAERVRDASEDDRPRYERLAEAIEAFEEDPTDDDAAEEVLFCLEDITDATNMDVVQDGDGGHLRVADGKPGKTCEHCGNGYATQRVLDVHMDQDCTGLDVTRDYSLDRDDDGTDYDVLHSAAESYASEVTNSGRAAQVAFLRAHGWTDEDITAEIEQHDGEEAALDYMVIDAASHTASHAYNDGQADPDIVTASLDARRFKSAEALAAYHGGGPDAPRWGENLTDDDPLAWFVNGHPE